MFDQDPIAPAVASAIVLVAQRLAVEPSLPWLLAGDAAAALQGVPTQQAASLLLLTGAPELGRLATLLAADEREPLASRPAPGYAASPRGTFELSIENAGLRTSAASSEEAEQHSSNTLSQFTAVALELVGDAVAVGGAGALPLALEYVWPSRVEGRLGATRVPLLPLELALAVELLQGHHDRAYAIADHLFATGVRWERLDGALARLPALERPLWELMDRVRPLANRARSRRARRQLGWGQGKKKQG